MTGGHEPCKKSKESKETQLDFHNADVYFDLLANKWKGMRWLESLPCKNVLSFKRHILSSSCAVWLIGTPELSWAVINVISYTCALPTRKSQNVCRENCLFFFSEEGHCYVNLSSSQFILYQFKQLTFLVCNKTLEAIKTYKKSISM